MWAIRSAAPFSTFFTFLQNRANFLPLIIAEVDERVRCLKRNKNVSIKTALVYAGTLAPIVEADGYFDAIVPIESILGLLNSGHALRDT